MRLIGLLFVCHMVSIQAHAQLQTIIHSTFPIDTAETVTLQLYGAYEVEPWPGNNILTETKIKLFDGSKSLLNFFLEGGRYDIEYTLEDKTITMISKDDKRLPVGESSEEVNLRVFMPDTFAKLGPGIWVKSN